MVQHTFGRTKWRLKPWLTVGVLLSTVIFVSALAAFFWDPGIARRAAHELSAARVGVFSLGREKASDLLSTQTQTKSQREQSSPNLTGTPAAGF